MIFLIFILFHFCSGAGKVPPKESLWSAQKRFDRLMEITKGGIKYTKLDINDFQHLILDGIQAEQVNLLQ